MAEGVLATALGPADLGLSQNGGYVMFGGLSSMRGHDHDELLQISGRKVTWIAGGVVRKSFTVTSPVLQAMWVFFPELSERPCLNALCVLESQCLTVYATSGAVYSVPLPCKASRLWMMPTGLLVERSPSVSPPRGSDQPIPLLFSLQHPLDELRPLGDEQGLDYFCAPDLDVLALCTLSDQSTSLLITFSRTKRVHLVYVVEMDDSADEEDAAPSTPVRSNAPAAPAAADSPEDGAPPGFQHQQRAPKSLDTSFGGGGGWMDTDDASGNRLVAAAALRPQMKASIVWSSASVQGSAAEGESPLSTPASDCFLATDRDGMDLLCVFCKPPVSQVFALKVSVTRPLSGSSPAGLSGGTGFNRGTGKAQASQQPGQVQLFPAFSLAAASAVAVCACRAPALTAVDEELTPSGSIESGTPPLDILVLHPNGTLLLYVGQTVMVTVCVPAVVLRQEKQQQGGTVSGGGGGGNHVIDFSSVGGQPGVRPGSTNSVGSTFGMGKLSLNGTSGGLGIGLGGTERNSTTPTSPGLGDGGAGGVDLAVSSLRDGLGNRVTLVLDDGSHYRVSLPFYPLSPVVIDCLDALDHCSSGNHPGKPPEALLDMLRSFLLLRSRPKNHRRTESAGLLEWDIFASVFTPLAGLAGSAPGRRTPSPAEGGGSKTGQSPKQQKTEDQRSNDDDWAWLLQSDMHRSLQYDPHLQCINRKKPEDLVGGARSGQQQRVSGSGGDNSASGAGPGGAAADPLLDDLVSQYRPYHSFILGCLHMVYEEYKLDMRTHSLLLPLGRLLHSISLGAGDLHLWADYYARDQVECNGTGGEAAAAGSAVRRAPAPLPHESAGGVASSYPNVRAGSSPPDLMRTMSALLTTRASPAAHTPPSFPLLNSFASPSSTTACSRLFRFGRSELCGRTRQLWSYYSIIGTTSATAAAAAEGGDAVATPACIRVVEAMVRDSFTQAKLASCPFGVALPLQDAIRQSRLTRCLPTVWPVEAYELIGRPDLASLCSYSDLDGEGDSTTKAEEGTGGGGGGGGGDADGMNVDKSDGGGGVSGAARVARGGGFRGRRGRGSSTRSLISMMASSGGGESEGGGATGGFIGAGTAGAAAGAGGAAAAAGGGSGDGGGGGGGGGDSLGEGKFDGMGLTEGDSWYSLRFGKDRRLEEVQRLLNSSRPQVLVVVRKPEMSDHDVIAEQQNHLMLLAQRNMALAIGRGALTLRTAELVLTEKLPVPEICLLGLTPSNNATVTLDAATLEREPQLLDWAAFHNGAASGLRLDAAPGTITRTWIVNNKPEELTHQHAGLLMVLGLQGHLSALALTDLYGYLQSYHDATTVGILLGLSAAKRGTMDSNASKVAQLHIPYLLPREMEVSSTVQTAALVSIGLIYQGTAHRLMTEILLAEIGRRPMTDFMIDREGYSLAAGLALGMVTLGAGSGGSSGGLADLHIDEKLQRYIDGGIDPDLASAGGGSGQAGGGDNQCSRIKEGPMVNVNVTAPGATLAMGLMFLRTNNAAVASRLAIPNSFFLLDYCRPDFVLLRVLARNMVMWDAMEPTLDWVTQQVPPVIQRAIRSSAARRGPLSPLAQWISKAADEDEDDDDIEAEPDLDDEEVDVESMQLTMYNIAAGACMALALRYAGTANARAFKIMMEYIGRFRKIEPSKTDRPTLETCLVVCCMSMSVVMAGTGNVDGLRVLRALRGRVEAEVSYGHHLGLHMAIGFMFLGGGCCTFSNSNEAVVALVTALYPRFPSTPSDNSFHLQALRHLYVLAVEDRSLRTYDADNGKPCYAPIVVECKDGSIRSMTAPALLPVSVDNIVKVTIDSCRYWPMELTPATNPVHMKILKKQHTIHLKRRSGFLPYLDDPRGTKSILSRFKLKSNNSTGGLAGTGSVSGSVEDQAGVGAGDSSRHSYYHSSSAHIPSVNDFEKYIAAAGGADGASGGGGVDEFAVFCNDVLCECVAGEKVEMILSYMAIHDMVTRLHLTNTSQALQNVKIIFAYYERPVLPPTLTSDSQAQEPLLQIKFIDAVRTAIDAFFLSSGFSAAAAAASAGQHPVCKYIMSGSLDFIASDSTLPANACGVLSAFLNFYEIPPPSALLSALELYRNNSNAGSLSAASDPEGLALFPQLVRLLPHIPVTALQRVAPYLVSCRAVVL